MIETSIEQVTPSQAEEWLKLNRRNRSADRARVGMYARAMTKGEWIFNGDPIRFDDSDGLLDGQHRLLAIVEANVTLSVLVVRGLPAVAQETMDRGKKRSTADALKMRGETNCSALAGALVWIAKFEAGNPKQNSRQVTTQEAMALLESHPGIRLMGQIVEPVRSLHLIQPSLAWALAYQFTQLDFENAREFFARLGSGADMAETNPIFRLRAYLIAEIAKSKGKNGPWYTAALTIKAWNAWREGRQVSSLRFRIQEPAAEEFPVAI